MINFILSSNMDLGMVTINSKLLILAANEKFKDLYGIKEKDTLFKKSELAQTVTLFFEQKKEISGILIHETMLETPLHFLIYSCHFNEGDELFQTIVICDISEMYRNWESRIEEEKRKLIGDMAAGTADTILNPLAVIKGSLQLIKKRIKGISTLTYDAIHSIESCVSLANQEVNRIHSRTLRLLQMGKPFEMELTSVSLSSILQEFIPYIQQEALKWNFRLVFESPSHDGQLLVHRSYLKEVFREIINNSFEASSKGGKLQISIEVAENYVFFRIIDYGDGIAVEIESQIMRPFFTTKDNSFGLGLSFCDIVLHKLGGRMDIQSSSGQTVVNVYLPIVRF